MKKRLTFCAFVYGCTLLLAGCVTTTPGVSITSHAPPPDSTDTTATAAAWQPRRAWIFIEGVKQATTPATVVVRRQFEITNVSLHTGPRFDQVRRYELDRTVTSDRRMIDFSFRGGYDGSIASLNVTDLSRDRNGNFIIPFFEFPVQITDHEYDLVLIVRD